MPMIKFDTVQGPICSDSDYWGYCGHESCDLIPPVEYCEMNPAHGLQAVREVGSGPGYAGGPIYWSVLACGHTNLDESADVRAAR